MPKLGAFKSFAFPVPPMMDTRSTPDSVPVGYSRLNKNLVLTSAGRLSRLPGWSSFMYHDEAGTPNPLDNSDLHDQLIPKVFGYESYSYTVPGTSEVTSYLYPYRWPDIITPGSGDALAYEGVECGYALDAGLSFEGPVESEQSGFYIWRWFAGYPYYEDGGAGGQWGGSTYTVTDLPYLSDAGADCNTGDPYFYVMPYYEQAYGNFTPSEITEGYGYGESTPFYTTTPESVYEYCGEEAYYRPYCADTYINNGAREPVTLMREFQSGGGARKLVAATMSRIYARNARSRNWRILADGKGGRETCDCGNRRFKSAQLGDSIIFTNNYDRPLLWGFDDPADGCDVQAAIPIQDLIDLDIDKALLSVEYKGFMFLLNLEVEGVRYISKAIWSDYAAPKSWIPSFDSLAGDSDIGDPGEAIVTAAVLGDYLFIYKERSIWRVTLVDPDQGLFNFQQVYHGEQTPRYPNTLVSTGLAHFYMGQDNIYFLDLYSQRPSTIDWVERASGIIYNDTVVTSEGLVGGVDPDSCGQAVSGWDPVRNLLWFSWVAKRPTNNSSVAETTQPGFPIPHSITCPNRSLILNLKFPSSSYVDHGFTSFCTFREYRKPSLADWMVELGVCTESQVDRDPKEGAPFYINPSLVFDYQFLETPDGLLIITPDGTYIIVPGVDGINYIWNETEDPDLPMDPNSLCAALDTNVWEDICEGCDEGTFFLMASAADWCIKKFDPDAYHREHFTFSTGLYSQAGFDTVSESPALSFGTDAEKYLKRMMVEFSPPTQSPIPQLHAMLGYSSQPECPQWDTLKPQDLACQIAEEGRPFPGQRRYDKAYFNRYVRGRYLFYRIWVTGTTGETAFSRVDVAVRPAESGTI